MNEKYSIVVVPNPIAAFSPDWTEVEILQPYERIVEIMRHPMTPQDSVVHAAFAKHILDLNAKIASLEKRLGLEKRLDMATKMQTSADTAEASGG